MGVAAKKAVSTRTARDHAGSRVQIEHCDTLTTGLNRSVDALPAAASLWFSPGSWAGKYRTTGKNIGVEAYRIPPDLQELLNDVSYWIENETYEGDEIAARFHHRLVAIHPYPNGNGRHARLAADLLLREMGRPRFTWGRENLTDPGKTRSEYITALRAADDHDYGPLLEFVRS